MVVAMLSVVCAPRGQVVSRGGGRSTTLRSCASAIGPNPGSPSLAVKVWQNDFKKLDCDEVCTWAASQGASAADCKALKAKGHTGRSLFRCKSFNLGQEGLTGGGAQLVIDKVRPEPGTSSPARPPPLRVASPLLSPTAPVPRLPNTAHHLPRPRARVPAVSKTVMIEGKSWPRRKRSTR